MRRLSATIQSWPALRRFARDARGVSAVEFAMLLPLLMTLYLGAVEVSQGISIDRKVTLVTRTVADLASQATSISNNEMSNILNASVTVASPYSPTMLKVVVSSIAIDSNGAATIVWSDTYQGTARGVGQAVTLPALLRTPNTSLIWSEVSYLYTPTIGYVISGSLNLSDQIYMRPRLTASVARTAS